MDFFCQDGPGAAASSAAVLARPQCVGLGALRTGITGIAFLMLCVYPVPVSTYLLSLLATMSVLVQRLAPCVDNREQAVAWVSLSYSL